MSARWPGRVGFLLAGVAAGATVAMLLAVHRQLPGDDVPPMGLAAPVDVTFDARAVPTIRAQSLEDAARVQGYLVARERMFQLELQRRTARGELAEVFGAGALPLDRLHRVYAFAQVAADSVQHLPPRQRALIDAYAAGVNAFIQARPKRWGIELAMLGVAPRPWTAADSLAVVLLMHEDLSTSWRTELRAGGVASLPAEQRRFLMPRVTPRDLLIVADAEPQRSDTEALLPVKHAMLDVPSRDHASGAPDVPPDVLGLPEDAGETRVAVGSNNWVVAGSRTVSGKPLLANDPHLGLRAPGLWYAVRVEVAGRTAQGVSLPGVPGIVIGQNDRVAWGFTNVGTDVQDVYREEKIGERAERISVKGAPAEELRVPLGKHGPQIRPGHSLRWAALDPKNVGLPLDAIVQAGDWASFNAAFDGYRGPAQNVVYADIFGHIGWRMTGVIPIRAKGVDGSVPLDGANPEHDWRGYVAQEEMPRVLDPERGYLVTANQRVIGTSFPHHVAAQWASPSRARRIAELIEATPKLSRADMERIQLDAVSVSWRAQARLWEPHLGEPERSALRGWDGGARADDGQAVIARSLHLALFQDVQSAFLPKGAERLTWAQDDAVVEAVLAAAPQAVQRAGLGDKGELLRTAMARAREWRKDKPGNWGALNATQIHHPFGMRGGLLSVIFDPPQMPQSGCATCPRASQPAFGQSMRFVVDWSDPGATSLVLPLGQSGHVGSGHRLDQRAAWLNGDPKGERTRLQQPPLGQPLRFRP